MAAPRDSGDSAPAAPSAGGDEPAERGEPGAAGDLDGLGGRGDLGAAADRGGAARGPGPLARWLLRFATLAALCFAAGVASALAGPAAAVLVFAGGGLLLQLVRLALPAAAHGAFQRGELASAKRRYRWIARTAWLPRRRLYAELSLAAVALADGAYARAQAALDDVDGAALDLSARAAWLNNRAYALLRQGQDLDLAFRLSAAAMELRPDVPGIRHTHGLALLARGQLDAAIAALDELHHLGELPPALEAERCADLARAWSDKGEQDYAAEYRGRAALAKRRGAV